MPISMKGSPSPTKVPPQPESDPVYLGFGSGPHYVPRTKLIFAPSRGGWVQPEINRAGQERAPPPHWEQPSPPKKREPVNFEVKHEGEWMLSMEKEIALGLAPPHSGIQPPLPAGGARRGAVRAHSAQ